jgi:hypothetical protein
MSLVAIFFFRNFRFFSTSDTASPRQPQGLV